MKKHGTTGKEMGRTHAISTVEDYISDEMHAMLLRHRQYDYGSSNIKTFEETAGRKSGHD
jgi:hypothetical protein